MKANTSYFVPFANGKDQSSARVQAADHWRASDPNNMNVLYPRLHTNEYSNNTLNSTWWYRNGSFLRLKNVELGYQFDKKLVQRWKNAEPSCICAGKQSCRMGSRENVGSGNWKQWCTISD